MEETGVVSAGNGRASPRLAGGSTPRSWLSPQDARMRGGPRKRIRAHPRSGGGRNQQGGTGRGDTVRLPARASSGGMSVAGKRRSSLGRGTATFGGRGGRRGNAANPSRQQAAIRLRPRSWNRLRTRSGAARGENRRGGVKPRGRNASRHALVGVRDRCGGRVTDRRGSGRAEAGRQRGPQADDTGSSGRIRGAARRFGTGSTGRSRAR